MHLMHKHYGNHDKMPGIVGKLTYLKPIQHKAAHTL